MIDLSKLKGHTPGPYVVIENPNKPGDYYVARESGVCLWDDTGSILNKADAELLAASPDLLAEVVRLREAYAEPHEVIRKNHKTDETIRGGMATIYLQKSLDEADRIAAELEGK